MDYQQRREQNLLTKIATDFLNDVKRHRNPGTGRWDKGNKNARKRLNARVRGLENKKLMGPVKA